MAPGTGRRAGGIDGRRPAERRGDPNPKAGGSLTLRGCRSRIHRPLAQVQAVVSPHVSLLVRSKH